MGFTDNLEWRYATPKNLEPKALLPIGYRGSEDVHARLPKIRFGKSDLFDFRP